MATQNFNRLSQQDVHSVGNLVSAQQYIQDYANGAFFTEDVDNFHLVQGKLSADDVTVTVNGAQVNIGGANEIQVKYLNDETDPNHIFLTAGVERVHLPQDGISQFYNGAGDKERVVYLTHGLLFDVSAYEHATPGTEVKVGDKVFYDTTKKKFVVDPSATADAYPVFFEVRRTEADTQYTLGQPTIRLVVIKGV
jgi:hypothetical protein